MGKRALIFGISGQDAAYLASSLLNDGYEVHGSSRNPAAVDLSGSIGPRRSPEISLHACAMTDAEGVHRLIEHVRPDEIYNLAGQSSVGLSFSSPTETFDGIANGAMHILEALRSLGSSARFFNAASSEAFGEMERRPADETTAFRPRSPYGVAKAAAFWMVRNYREAYGLFACSGVLFNHESPLRPAQFVTRKIVRTAVEIARGRATGLTLGKLDITRDWGWAPEYVEAMRLMLGSDRAEDMVIATGCAATLEAFVARAFARVGLDHRTYVRTDAALHRPLDLAYSVGDPARIAERLGWRAQIRMPELVDRLVDAELATPG